MAITSKRVFAKIRDSSGFITTLDPIVWGGFSEQKNKGQGTARFTFPATLGSYGEGSTIWYNNEVEIIIVDIDSGADGLIVYKGVISDYSESSRGGKDSVEVTLESYTFQLYNTILKSGLNILFKTQPSGDAIQETLEDAQSREVADVIKRIIDLYRLENPSPKLNYTATSIPPTGSNMTYTWIGETCGDALEECMTWLSATYFIRITPNGVISLEQKPATATHFLSLGKSFSSYDVVKDMTQLTNSIPFSNGSTEPRIFKIYSDATSISRYGLRLPQSKVFVDRRISLLASADQKMNALLSARKEPVIRTKLKVLDNNFSDDGLGYDIENILTGDTVTIEGLDELNSQSINVNLTIVRHNKTLNECDIELEGVPLNPSLLIIENSDRVAEIQSSDIIPRVISGSEHGYNLTLQNNWVNFDVNSAGAQFWKDGEGRVYIWGIIKSGTTTSGTIIATLPPAFRPTGTEIFLSYGFDGTNHSAVRLEVRKNGNIVLVQTIPTASVNVSNFLSLGGIGFFTRENTTHEKLSFRNSWRAYVDDFPLDDYPRPELYKSIKTGIVWARGLTNGGTENASITRIPDDFRPQNRIMVPGVGNNNFRRINVIGSENSSETGEIYTSSAVSGEWLSLSNAHWLARTGNKYQYPEYTNSFTTHASTAIDPYPWGRPGYYVDEFGFCHLEGLLQNGGVNLSCFTLPIHARPKKRHIFSVVRDNGVLGAIELNSDGTVVPRIYSTGWTSLCGIVFPTF